MVHTLRDTHHTQNVILPEALNLKQRVKMNSAGVNICLGAMKIERPQGRNGNDEMAMACVESTSP